MVQVSYKRSGTPAKPIKMTKEMLSGTPNKFKKGQVLGAQASNFKGADINKAPGYSKLKNKLKKKGLQTNYSN